MLRKSSRRRSSLHPNRAHDETILSVSSCSSIDDETDEDFKFPTKDELSSLPTKFQEALMSVVLDSMRVALLPRLVFLAAKRKRKVEEIIAQNHTSKPSASFLLSLSIFHKWSNVEEVHAALTLSVLQPKQALIFEGDLVPEVYFVTSGTFQLRKKVLHDENGCEIKCKGFPDKATRKVGVISADGGTPKCIQEEVFFTDQPATETIKAITSATVWVLSKAKYFDLLAKQTAERRAFVEQNCFQSRKNLIVTMVPLSTTDLLTTKIFGNVPEPLLSLLITKLEPRVFLAGEALCKYGKYCSDAYFVARGQVQVSYGKDATHLCIGGRGSVWGEVASLFVKPSSLLVEAVTVCDVLCLSHDNMMSVLSSSGSGGAAQNPVVAQVLRIAHKMETEWEAEANTRFLPLIEAIPFVSACCTALKERSSHDDVPYENLVLALLEQFTSGVYAANDTITSASSACESIIIPVRGRARITALSEDLTMGEAVGFTCLIAHRWKYHICAVEPVQTLELSRHHLRATLSSFQVLDIYERNVKGLMYPLVYPADFSAALLQLVHCANPPMFEPSRQAYETSLEPRVAGNNRPASLAPAWQRSAPGSYKKKKIHAIVGHRPPVSISPVEDIDTWGEEGESPTGSADLSGNDDSLTKGQLTPPTKPRTLLSPAELKALTSSPAFRQLTAATMACNPARNTATETVTCRNLSTAHSQECRHIVDRRSTSQEQSSQCEVSFLSDVHSMFLRMTA
ncbi:cyclic nucleotide-binding protein, putative [Bodo saltans]|uniref:Cyclic nucleotide-binding protein, putative n=1 Tax=Bodo saltans TaxID=75058 RepID=A0A0S4JR60_BODSA|nr:cyclic nucleotide-binding protein, putative [Bodo saltans]|eukprot:CUG91806.1 cyclic nucleotide-binding protein, putative [Bodo saltans]